MKVGNLASCLGRCLGPLIFVMTTVMVASGCGDGRPETVPVTGEVFYKGEPVEDATVVFSSSGGPPAQGKTDAAGKFTLRTFETDDGATPGTNRVTITKLQNAEPTEQNPYPISRNLLPQKYSRPDSSGLSEEVSKENHEFRFDLTD